MELKKITVVLLVWLFGKLLNCVVFAYRLWVKFKDWRTNYQIQTKLTSCDLIVSLCWNKFVITARILCRNCLSFVWSALVVIYALALCSLSTSLQMRNLLFCHFLIIEWTSDSLSTVRYVTEQLKLQVNWNWFALHRPKLIILITTIKVVWC